MKEYVTFRRTAMGRIPVELSKNYSQMDQQGAVLQYVLLELAHDRRLQLRDDVMNVTASG
jgi:hypothetical protein